MDGFVLTKSLHALSTLLLFGAILALGWWRWRLSRGALAGLAARLFRWPALYGGLLVLGLVGLPVSGWWLVHLASWPLSQLWLFGGSLLYLLGALCWLWPLLRSGGAGAGSRVSLTLAGLGTLCFVAVALLMALRPA